MLSERPDAIGFRNSGIDTLVIECKTSRSDFLADRKKRHREPGKGLGSYRWFMAEPGIIEPADLPDKWGLLLVVGRKVHIAAGATANRTYWPPETDIWRHGSHEPHLECVVLFSMLKRLQLGIGQTDFEYHTTATYKEKASGRLIAARDQQA